MPVIAVNALDDPFIAEHSLPRQQDVGATAPVRLVYHQHGGHCGFIGHEHERRYHLFDGADLGSTRNSGGQVSSRSSDAQLDDLSPITVVPPHGWLAEELARGLQHVDREVRRAEGSKETTYGAVSSG